MLKISRDAIIAASAPEDVEFDDASAEQFEEDSLLARAGMPNANKYQSEIFKFVDQQVTAMDNQNPPKSLLVQAVAGAGKTRTIVAAANLIPKKYRVLFLAFNKSIADELQEKLPNHVKARTLNSLGASLLYPYLAELGVLSPDLSSYRTSLMIRDELNYADQEAFGADIRFLVNMCKALGIIAPFTPHAEGINGQEASDNTLRKICNHFDRAISQANQPVVFNTVRRILKAAINDSQLYKSGKIDFDDQKWIPVCKKPAGKSLASAKYDVVIMDEAQDASLVDLALIKLVLKPTGFVVGVGDSKQSIYGFRGADSNAIDQFIKEFKAVELPMSITYRCAKSIVAHAKKLVPVIEAADTAPDGKVTLASTPKYTDFKPGDLIVCRNNAPVVDLAMQLVMNGVRARVIGQSIGQNVVDQIYSLAGEKVWVDNPKKPGKKMPKISVDNVSTRMLAIKLDTWLSDVKLTYRQGKDDEDTDAINRAIDFFEMMHLFISHTKSGKVTDIIKSVESLFDNEDDPNADEFVKCTTIHKAKGLEADRVFFYKSSLLYPKWIDTDSWQFTQERNLDYIARTRAKTELIYFDEI